MTAPFLSTVSDRARRAYPIIVRGTRTGLSTREIQRLLTGADLGIRRQTLLDIIRREKGIEAAGAELRFVRRDRIPDPRRIPEALTRTLRSFSFKVRLRGILADTGELFERFVNVALDRPITRGAIENIAEGFVAVEAERYPFELTDVLLVEAVKGGRFGTLL